MAISALTQLNRLVLLQRAYGKTAGAEKLDLLCSLDRLRLTTARQVLQLHEVLCFLQAYPDDEAVLSQVKRMLDRFRYRSDLRRFRTALADSGIAGTNIHYPFFYFTADWLVRRWPALVSINWRAFKKREHLTNLLHLMLPYSETVGLDQHGCGARDWLKLLKSRSETDAAFLLRRVRVLHPSPFGRETMYEQLDVPLRLSPGPDSPSRTRAGFEVCPPVFQVRPLDRSRSFFRREIRLSPAVRTISPRDGERLINRARESMVVRARDLDNFIHADPNDVRVFEFDDGLRFACFGLIPERRLMIESVYGVLTLKNNVPIGYALASGLFGSSEVMYNIFETFRGGESALIYARLLAAVRHLFGADTFSVDPIQLGHDNREGQKSGAFWFYHKLGFRPKNSEVRSLMLREARIMKRDPRHRSTRATLQKLSAEYVFLHAGRPRRDVLGLLSLENIGLNITRHLAQRFGGKREEGIRTCAREAAALLGVRSERGWSRGERLAWERWSPVIVILPGIETWPRSDRQSLVRVVKAKGGHRESDFVRHFDAHRRLRRAVLALAAEDQP